MNKALKQLINRKKGNSISLRFSPIPTRNDYCSSGYGSSIAGSLLEHHHYSNIVDLVGGFDPWEEAIVNPSLQSASALQEPGGRTPQER